MLDQKYGDISARLSQLLEASQRESFETRKELTRAVDTLVEVVNQLIVTRRAGKPSMTRKQPERC
ncbi:MAG: hypothetical protein QW057_01425 [Candidatus Bathyarchaeia archaeon]